MQLILASKIQLSVAKAWLALCVVWCCLLLTACGSDDVDAAYTDCRYDIVTYQGVTSAGQERYELVGRDNAPSVMLLATGANAPKDSPIGRRLLLRYTPCQPLTGDSCRIVTHAATAIVSDSLRYTEKPLAHYLQDNSPVKLGSLWRTGNFVNLHCQLEYTGHSRHFYLLVDSTTWHNDTVHCHLVHNVFGDTTRHWRECFASFFVGTVWQQPSCRVMRIHINDVDRPQVTFRDFAK
ncbi:MAG: hypothetical protein IKR25_13210 [Muribaculaceae bacterium]|nr:hypothetical protein [Muribaculaceae bacterium]